MADAARALKREIKKITWDAVKATAKELLDIDVMEKLEMLVGASVKIVQIFLSKLDQEAMEAAVSAYETELRSVVSQLRDRKADVAEATRAAPTFHSEEARAEAFGARSLNEFKRNPLYTVPRDSADNHSYPVDLANQEGMGNAHTLDKHVGQSDSQLIGRLRDQSNAPHASSFADLSAAQKYTQGAMDDPVKQQEIKRWLRNCETQNRSDGSILSISKNYGQGVVTGETVTRQDYSQRGDAAASRQTHGVHVTLKYQPDREPPYVVLTSYPK